MTDKPTRIGYLNQIKSAWDKAQNGLWDFAYLATDCPEDMTYEQIGNAIRRGADVTREYVWAVELRTDLEKIHGKKKVDTWAVLDISFWRAAGRLDHQVSSNQDIDFSGLFTACLANEWTVRQFTKECEKVSGRPVAEGSYVERVARMYVEIDRDLINCEMLDAPEEVTKPIRRAALLLQGRMKKIMDVIEWMVNEKFAKNTFNAAAIANGLKLAGLPFEKQKERVQLYRKWRDSKIFNSTSDCFVKAIAGEEPPKELFEKESA